MSDYTKAVDFAVKDGLITGNPAKVIKGTEINTEFAAIQVSNNSKANRASPTFTGTMNGVHLTLSGTLTANLIDGGSF